MWKLSCAAAGALVHLVLGGCAREAAPPPAVAKFHKALCAAAGNKAPLYECSNFDSKAAGERFQAMLAQGAAAPWQDTLEKLTGTRQIDARAISEYFQPLMQWLTEENKGEQCGW
jgi:peptidyl-dipeptidase A